MPIKENNEINDTKEIKDTKETKDVKTNKNVREIKAVKGTKETKDVKTNKNIRNIKVVKSTNATKDIKTNKNVRDVKGVKGIKETKDVKSNKNVKEDIITEFSSQYFINREISVIQFNKRVLYEALDKTHHPLLERLKFITIFSSNLDEFFMIRVAGLKNQLVEGVNELSYDGKNPAQQLKEIREILLPLYKLQEEILNNDILPELAKSGIVFKEYKDLDKKNRDYVHKYFIENVFPILTPLMLGPANPFPRLVNRSVNIAFLLKDKDGSKQETKLGILQIPTGLSRLVKLEAVGDKEKYPFILLEQIISAFAEDLYPGYELESVNTFRVTRDADIEIAEDEAEDLLYEIKEQVILRRWDKDPVRLEVSKSMSKKMIDYLRTSLELEESDVYSLNRPVNLGDLMALMSLDLTTLKDKPFTAKHPTEFKERDVFETIAKNDILVHHPFDSFTNSVLKFMNQAADDPNVIAIKITLYRTGKNSAIISALQRAAISGKNVTAFVELKARFDEENNIVWARELENNGVHVVYGVPGLKTHCKILMVVRKEQNKLKTYLHIATGNYNQITARLYTDIGLFTANEEFALDGIHLFNYLTGYSLNSELKHFIVAPKYMKNKLVELIRYEAEKHTVDNPGLIFAQFNSLAHREIIEELYKASQKGVQIKLICRGICCLRPGVKGVSENIEVHSIVGRFLEHTRIYHFKHSGTYLASADLMTRSMHRRVEIIFPVHNTRLRDKLLKILEHYWKDNTKAWVLKSDGNYEKIVCKAGEKKFSAQQYYLNQLKALN